MSRTVELERVRGDETPVALTNGKPPILGIRAEGLEKTFPTRRGPAPGVHGVDLSVAPGETVALLGPNGAGKSTTIDMILGLLRPDRGSVEVFGLRPADAIEAGARDLSVLELLSMMASLYPAPLPVDRVLDLTGIRNVADRRTQRLSGGETQRVRFAVALVSDPELLVLDEPTAGMDVETRHAFWAVMRTFAARGKTVLFATHYLEEADEHADRVLLMANGTIVADGSTTEIKSMVGSRTIRATLPAVDAASLAELRGVTDAERHGDAIVLTCSSSDDAIRALLARYPEARDIEVRAASLEEAVLRLTGREALQTSIDPRAEVIV